MMKVQGITAHSPACRRSFIDLGPCVPGSANEQDCRNTDIEADRGALHRLALARVMQDVQAGVELDLEPANCRFAPKQETLSMSRCSESQQSACARSDDGGQDNFPILEQSEAAAEKRAPR
jgi:hypothetical protein